VRAAGVERAGERAGGESFVGKPTGAFSLVLRLIDAPRSLLPITNFAV
jgi:hypothetical protein